jgi:hypothetical protein
VGACIESVCVLIHFDWCLPAAWAAARTVTAALSGG